MGIFTRKKIKNSIEFEELANRLIKVHSETEIYKNKFESLSIRLESLRQLVYRTLRKGIPEEETQTENIKYKDFLPN